MSSKKTSFEKNAIKIFQVLGISLFMILSYYSIGLTAENKDLSDESLYEMPDSLFSNTFWLFIAFMFFFLLYCVMIHCGDRWNTLPAAEIVSIIITIFCVYWVGASKTAPQADQLYICNYAEAFNRGDYSGLVRGEYVGIYRQQLGIITLLRILFYFFGAGNYHSFQYLSAIMAGVMVFSGYNVVKYISNYSKAAEIYYIIMAMFCVPLYIYVPFVYGEIISTSLLLLAAWMMLSCLKRFSWGKVLMLGLSSGLAVQIRENSLIVLIGFLIVLIVKLIGGNIKNAVILLFSILAGIFLFWLVITYGIYRDKIPDDSESMPAILHIAMGLNWDKVNPGWYNAYSLNTYRENDCDVEKSKEAAMDYVREFMQHAKDEEKYAVNFYVHKLTSQWAAPMYQCLAMNNKIVGEQDILAETVYYGWLRDLLQKFMNIYQLLIYGAVLIVLILKRKKWVYLEEYVLLIGIFGGFLFSLMWEAKTRYVFPYFLLMIPYAAVGLDSLNLKIEQKVKKSV